MNKLFEQKQIKDSLATANNYRESLTSKELMDGETDSKVTSCTKGVEQLSMLEARNKGGPQTLKWPHSTDGQKCLNSQNNGYICLNKKLVYQNDRRKSLLMSYDDLDVNTHYKDDYVPIESRKLDFKQLKLCEVKKQQSLSPSSTLFHLHGPRQKSEAHINPEQPETTVCTNASCGSHFISESLKEQDKRTSHFNNFHHSPKSLNNKASHHGVSETETVLQSPSIKPRRLPPLKRMRSRPDSQPKILKNVPMSQATFISGSQQPQDTTNELFYTGLQQLASSCNNQCMSVGYDRKIEKGKMPKHLEKIDRVQRTELPKCIENPFNGAINQEIIKSLNSDIDVQICASKKTNSSHQLLRSKINLQEEHLIPSNIYRNAPSDVDGLAEGLNKVHICDTNHALVASRRRVAVCDRNDSAFRERMKTRALRKRFELPEGSLEAFLGNKNENTPPRRTLGSTTRLRRIGVCDKTDEFLCRRIKLRTMKKRFGQTDELSS